MARWVRRMRQVPGYEGRAEQLFAPPFVSQYRIRRLALYLHRHHVVIGRGMYDLLTHYDQIHYASSVRREMLRSYTKC